LNLAIGQGECSLTPIKLVQLAAVIASNGVLFKPHLLKEVTRDGVVVARSVPPPDSLERNLELSPGDLVAVRAAMVSVVNDQGGTGGQARVDSILVAGKTGTAQNPHGEAHALFICFAPAAKPEIAIAVLVENAGHGSSAAAPLAQKVMQAYFHPAKGETTAVLTKD
jgi:cell division protein FtsI/penicillin-binding protein 2